MARRYVPTLGFQIVSCRRMQLNTILYILTATAVICVPPTRGSNENPKDPNQFPIINPEYIDVPIEESQIVGCFKDSPTCPDSDPTCRLMHNYVATFDGTPLELAKCSAICRKNNNQFFGKTSYGYCLCGDEPSVFGQTAWLACSQTCKDEKRYSNKEKYGCGGYKVVSVYRTCPRGKFGVDLCDRECHCMNDQPCSPWEGICFKTDSCAPGWLTADKTGRISNLHCNVHDCERFNGQCYFQCLANNEAANFPDCTCLPGYRMSPLHIGCEDIDECALHPYSSCTKPACINVPGSFVCGCDVGWQHAYHQPDGNFDCNDVDECNDPNPVCDPHTAVCQNTLGSYRCSCRNGFNMNSRNNLCEESSSILVHNDVSKPPTGAEQRQRQVRAEGDCVPTAITVNGGSPTSTTPTAYPRSQAVTLTAKVAPTCTTSVPAQSISWSASKLVGTANQIDLPSQSLVLVIPALYLEYGNYSVTVTGVFSGETTLTGVAYIKVESTSPSVLFVGGNSITLNVVNTMVTLSALPSKDPDSIEQNLYFKWACTIVNGLIHWDDPVLNSPKPNKCLTSVQLKMPETGPVIQYALTRFINPLKTVYWFHCWAMVKDRPDRGYGYSRLQVKFVVAPVDQTKIICSDNCGEKMDPPESLCSENCAEMDPSCSDKCPKMMNPSYPLVLRATCDVCNDAMFEWKLIDVDQTKNIIRSLSPLQTSSGLQKPVLNINAHVFENTKAEIYTISLTVFYQNNVYGQSTYSIRTNPIPDGGTCSITPLTGIATVTLFRIACDGFTGAKMPLSYQFASDRCPDLSAVVKDLGPNAAILTQGPQSAVNDVPLSAGLQEDNNAVCIFAFISDALMSRTVRIIQVTVVPKAVTPDIVKGLTSTLTDLSAAKDPLATSQFVTVLAATVNDPEAQTVLSLTEINQVRQGLLQTLAEVSNSNPTTVSVSAVLPPALLQQTATGLKKITAVASDMDVNSINAAINISQLVDNVQSSAALLSSEAQKSFLTDTYGSLMSSVSDMVTATQNQLNTNDSAANPNSVRKAKSVMENMMNAISSMTDSLSGTTHLGENKQLGTADLTASVHAVEPNTTAPTVIVHEPAVDSTSDNNNTPQQAAAVYIHPDVFNFMPADESKMFRAQMVTFAKNPIFWDKSAENITTSVVQLKLTHGSDNRPFNQSALSKGTWVALPTGRSSGSNNENLNYTVVVLTPDNMTAFTSVQRTDQNSALAFYAYVDVKVPTTMVGDNDQRIKDKYFSERLSGSVNISIFYGEPKDALIDTWTEDNRKFRSVWNFSFGKPPPVTKNHVWLTPEMFSKGPNSVVIATNTSINTTVLVGFAMIETGVKRYDRTAGRWTSEGCQVNTELSTPSHLVGTFFGDMVGGVTEAKSSGPIFFRPPRFFVPPNTLHLAADLKKLFDFSNPANLENWVQFYRNPVGIITVGSVLLLYALLLIWAHKRDRLDELMALPIDLADNVENARYVYFVTVFTGSRKGSGTSSVVYISLYGTLGTSASHRLACRLFPVLQRTHANIFLIRTVTSLGEITAVRFWHYNLGRSPRWFVSRVIVHDWAAAKKYYFLCKAWLSADVGDSSLDKTFLAATTVEAASFHNLFVINALSGVNDKYIWLSVVSRPPLSNFNRVQRLSCCLTLLLGYMFANILFFGQLENYKEDQFHLGPINFSWAKFAIGIESAIVMLPVTLLILTLFRHSRRRPREIKLIKDLDVVPAGAGFISGQVVSPPAGHRLIDSESFHSILYEGPTNPAPVGLLALQEDNAGLHASPSYTRGYNAVGGSASATMSRGARSSNYTQHNNYTTDSEFSSAIESDTLLIEHGWPWQVAIVAWVLVVLVSSAFSLFIILYTFEFGLNKSVDWAQTVTVSFFIGTFLEQPLKVLAVAVVLSLIFRKSEDIEFTKSDAIADQCVRVLNNDDIPRWNFIHHMRSHPHYKPPRRTVIMTLQDTFTREVLMYGLVTDLILYAIFLAMLLAIINMRRDFEIFMRNESLRRRLYDNNLYRDIVSREDLWIWLIVVWLNVVYQQDLSGVLEPINSRVGYVYQPPRITRFSITLKGDVPYTFTYSGGIPQNGSFLFQYDFLTTTKRVHQMLSNSWFNRKFAAMVLEYYIYTPYSDLVTQVLTVADMPKSGGVYVFHKIRSFRLRQFDSIDQQVAEALEVAYFVFTILFVIWTIHKLATLGVRKFFQNFWRVNDLLLATCSTLFFVVYIVLNVKIIQASSPASRLQKFPFDTLATLDDCSMFLLGMAALTGCIKCVCLMRYLPAVNSLITTLLRAFPVLSALFVQWTIFSIVATMFFHLALGVQILDFSTFQRSSLSVLFAVGRSYEYSRLVGFSVLTWTLMAVCVVMLFVFVFWRSTVVAIVAAAYTDYRTVYNTSADSALLGPVLRQLRTAVVGQASKKRNTPAPQKRHKNKAHQRDKNN